MHNLLLLHKHCEKSRRTLLTTLCELLSVINYMNSPVVFSGGRTTEAAGDEVTAAHRDGLRGCFYCDAVTQQGTSSHVSLSMTMKNTRLVIECASMHRSLNVLQIAFIVYTHKNKFERRAQRSSHTLKFHQRNCISVCELK